MRKALAALLVVFGSALAAELPPLQPRVIMPDEVLPDSFLLSAPIIAIVRVTAAAFAGPEIEITPTYNLAVRLVKVALLEHQRRAIEEAFKTRVFDQYGQAEMQSFWYECEAGRMHAHPLAGITEILRPDGTPAALGEMGEVVLTGLVNYAMPLVRYRVGDTARFATESCSCGRGMPVDRKSTR